MTTRTITFSLLLWCMAASFAHAEGGGLRLTYYKLHIYAEFNDNLRAKDDRITGMGYIREPSGLLFDLIQIIQSNRTALRKIDKDIFVSVGNNNKYLRIYQQTEPSYRVLKLNKIKHLDKKVLLAALCKELGVKTCRPETAKETWFYTSNFNLSSSETDQIEFGCFPCDNHANNYALTTRFEPSRGPNTPLAHKLAKPEFEKVTVNRQTIYHYFNKLIY